MTVPKAPPGEVSIKAALVHAKWLDPSKAGRGKPSKEMQEQADILVREHGYRIKGRTVSKSTGPSETVKVERVKVQTGTVVPDVIPQTRGDDLIPMVNGKPWSHGIRGVCNTCHVSLTHCPCISPKVWVDYQTEAVPTFKAPRGG